MDEEQGINNTGIIKLDMKDNKIICELEKNARQPISQLAKKVRLSKETVNYRIKRLEKEDIITGYATNINSTFLGNNLYMLFFKFQNITSKKEEEMIDYIAKKIPQISRLCSVEGNWDLALSFSAKDIFEFKRVYDNFIGRYGKYIERKHISIATKIYHFLHSLLLGINDRTHYISQEQEKIVKTDKIDENIIKMLREDCRIPTLEIARKLRLSANAIKRRINRLVKERVILAFKIKINDLPFGYQHHHVMLALSNIDEARKKALIGALIESPNVCFIVEAVGESDLEFEVHVRNSSELHALLKELRNKFNCIRSHQTILFCKSYFSQI
jgi:Lrp/AsnC family leucine-responsive transcriptional regulator